MADQALIIYRVNRRNPRNSGVIKKMMGQIRGLEESGVNVDFIVHDNEYIYCNEKKIYTRKILTSASWFKWRFFSYLSNLRFEKYDFVIVRYGLTTLSFLKWLRKVKTLNPMGLILIDMPTFPYTKEWQGMRGSLLLTLDQILNKRLHRFVDYMLHSGPERSIFEIPVMSFSNGIDTSLTPLRTPAKHRGYKLIAVGKWNRWHGLDRLIHGFRQYALLGEPDVHLDIIGEGPESKRLENLVTIYRLEKFISFKGVVNGSRLDEYFNRADLGIGTLGLFRKNVPLDSSLKHREYIARGLPFVFSGQDADLHCEEEFVLTVTPNEEYIDIERLKNFVDSIDVSKQAEKMRKFAEEHLSWSIKMKSLYTNIYRT